MSDPKTQLVGGGPVPADGSHTKLKPNGQQEDYVVLSPEERAKGFVRPIRNTYRHVGAPLKNPLRDLTPEEQERYSQFLYVKYEEYPKDPNSSVVGRYWTQAQLDRRSCNGETFMSQALAETYARDPKFYGATFCVNCGHHIPVNEFVWAGTDERVGS